MTDTPAYTPRPDVERGTGPDEREPDDLPPGGLPDGPQGDEVDPGVGRIDVNVGEDAGDLGEVAAAA